jgi:hypothetical protein
MEIEKCFDLGQYGKDPDFLIPIIRKLIQCGTYSFNRTCKDGKRIRLY